MYSARSPNPEFSSELFLASHKFDPLGATQLRVKLRIPFTYRQEPILSRLISNHKLIVNITKAYLKNDPEADGHFDLELRGTPEQIRQGLDFLKSLQVKITGKGGTSGDSWHY